jgi:hypothetical protein
VWLPGSQDLDTLKLLSDLIGDQWVAAATVSAAPDGGLSVSEGSERMDVAPPGFLRTLNHGAAVMLTGNTPPALVRTHAYYEQPRWRRLIGDDELRRHADMHGGAGPTTAERWIEKEWPDGLAEPATDAGAPTQQPRSGQSPRGSLGSVLSADYPPVHCIRHARQRFGPGGNAIPDQLRGDRGTWASIDVDDELAEELGQRRFDLTNPHERRGVLPHLLEVGPADLVAAVLTFPQLRDEWPHLELSDVLRHSWEASYPTLADDITLHHPSAVV